MMPEFQQIPILALSASVLEAQKLKSYQSGCNDFLSKPIDATILLHKLQEYLQLSWIFEDSLTPIKSVTNGGEILVRPEVSELEQVFEALAVGDFSAIEQESRRISQLDPQYQGFANRLLSLAQTFDEQAILQLLQDNTSDRSIPLNPP